MSLMVSPISNVSFRAQEAATQSAEDILSRPGAFTKPEPPANPEPKKKHSFLKFVAGVLITAGIIAGGLYGLKNGFPNVFKVTENIKDLKGIEKLKAYATTGVAKGAEYVEAGAGKIAEYANTAWEGLKGLFKGKA